jgi:hypothetical protein
MDPLSIIDVTIRIPTLSSLAAFREARSTYGAFVGAAPKSITERHLLLKYESWSVAVFRMLMPRMYGQLEHIDQYVLRSKDEVLLEFRKSYVNDCNMTSVAVSNEK